MFDTLFSEADYARIGSYGAVINSDAPQSANHEFLLEYIQDADVVISSWGTAPLDAAIMAKAGKLRLVCHAAGSIRSVVSEALWEKKVRVTSAAEAIAYGVAEFCLGLILTAPKRVSWLAESTRRGRWMEDAGCFGGLFEIYQQNIGIIGAGHIGRHLIRLLRNFSCDILVYDPFLSLENATRLGVKIVDTLDELFSACKVISLNAPTNESTRNMLRGHHFAAMQPGSVFINTAGSIQIHEAEFIEQLRKERFVACIDRCEQEPCAPEHPYRHLPNVLLTPHIAGVAAENRLRIGTSVADEIEQFIRCGKLNFEVTKKALSQMA